MSIAASLIIIAIGAVLAFAVRDTFDAVDLEALGYIVMALGAASLLITLVLMNTRRRTDVIRRPGRTVVMEPNQMVVAEPNPVVVAEPSHVVIMEPNRYDRPL